MENSEGRISLNGRKLKHLRKNMCLSQSLFVDRCNNSGGVISISTLKRAEAGKKVYFRTARDIAQVFSLEVSEILIELPGDDIDETVSGETSSVSLKEFVIGRTHQLEQSKFILRSIKQLNQGHLYYIRGMAGIGKSHLMSAIHKIAEAEGFFVLNFSIFEAATSRADILRELVRKIILKLTEKSEVTYKCIESFLAENELSVEQKYSVYSLLEMQIPCYLKVVTSDYGSRIKAEVSLILKLLRDLNKPTCLLIEDIHWGDDSLLMTLKIIASEIRNFPVALVLTSRLENDPLNKIWRSSVQNTPFTTLDLPPLTEPEARKLADSYTHVAGEYSRKCLELVEGNPLFLKLLMENYPNSLDNIPSSLTHLVEHKLETLDKEEKILITIASAIGHQFSLDIIKSVTNNKSISLDNIVELYLVHTVDKGQFQFSHDLIRQAIYQCIPKQKKYRIHQRIADYFKGVNSSLHAYHLKQAKNNEAAKALQVVAEKHYQKHNYSEALVQVDQALSISESYSLIFLKGTLLKLLDLPAKSTKYFEKALKLAKSDKNKLEACLELTDVYTVNQRYERSQYYLDQADKLAGKLDSPKINARINKYKTHLKRIRNSLNSVGRQLQYSQPEDLNGQLTQLQPCGPDLSLLDFTGEVKVALLHSTSGIIKDHETAVMKTSIMAFDEINENGGLLGSKIVYEIFDGKSDEWVFRSQAENIINNHKIDTIFGCSISSTRKQVKEIVEKYNSLLIYPFHYEGLEESENIAYIGPTPNLQALPAVEWLIDKNCSRFYFIGSDYIYPVVTNEILKDSILESGAALTGESYALLGQTDFKSVIDDIKKKKPDTIVMTLAGLESNKQFLRQFYEAGLKNSKTTILSLVLSDNDICEIPTDHCSGIYSLFSYFQNHNDVINDDFVREFKARYGKDQRVGGYMESGYVGVHLWAKAVQKCKSFDPVKVKEAMKGVSHYGPGGIAYLDENNQHVWRYVRIAQVGMDGEYHVIWSSDKPVAPEPFPASRTKNEWKSFLENLKSNRWCGEWELKNSKV